MTIIDRTMLAEGPEDLMFDPDFCEKRCPICTRARRGHPLARLLQTVELLVTFGGCPWGRARQRKYGVPPHQSLPPPGGDREDRVRDA